MVWNARAPCQNCVPAIRSMIIPTDMLVRDTLSEREIHGGPPACGLIVLPLVPEPWGWARIIR